MTRVAPEGAGLRLTIDLGALAANWRRVAAEAAPAECAAVVKADAYGIGIEQAVPALQAAGCRTFFVALPDEGRRVRAVAPDATIYVLSGYLADVESVFEESDLRPVVSAEAALGRAHSPRALNFDTGMNRLGYDHDAIFAGGSFKESGVTLIMSHLACADTPEHELNLTQLRRTQAFSDWGLPISLANSAGIFLGRDYHFDVVRPGIALYGVSCSPLSPRMDVVVKAEARVLQIRDAKAGETVGYGGAYRLTRDSRIAILGAGYADGYLRAAGSTNERPGAHVFIGRKRAPVIGRVSMDMIAADVTDIPRGRVFWGYFAELFGPNIPIEEVAAAAGTIGYELLTGLSRRAHRVYVNGPESS